MLPVDGAAATTTTVSSTVRWRGAATTHKPSKLGKHSCIPAPCTFFRENKKKKEKNSILSQSDTGGAGRKLDRTIVMCHHKAGDIATAWLSGWRHLGSLRRCSPGHGSCSAKQEVASHFCPQINEGNCHEGPFESQPWEKLLSPPRPSPSQNMLV